MPISRKSPPPERRWAPEKSNRGEALNLRAHGLEPDRSVSLTWGPSHSGCFLVTSRWTHEPPRSLRGTRPITVIRCRTASPVRCQPRPETAGCYCGGQGTVWSSLSRLLEALRARAGRSAATDSRWRPSWAVTGNSAGARRAARQWNHTLHWETPPEVRSRWEIPSPLAPNERG